jgi:hypothetical protein
LRAEVAHADALCPPAVARVGEIDRTQLIAAGNHQGRVAKNLLISGPDGRYAVRCGFGQAADPRYSSHQSTSRKPVADEENETAARAGNRLLLSLTERHFLAGGWRFCHGVGGSLWLRSNHALLRPEKSHTRRGAARSSRPPHRKRPGLPPVFPCRRLPVD